MELTLQHIASREEKSARVKRKTTKLIFKIIIFAVCLFYTFLLLTPFYTIFVQSFTSYSEAMSTLSFVWWPENFTFENYIDVTQGDFIAQLTGMPAILTGFLNTLWLSLVTVITGLFVSGLAAFAYAKLKFKGKEVLFMCMLVTIMIPTGTLGVPSYLFYVALGWVPGYLPLIVPSLFGGAMTIFFLRSYMMSIPTEVVEAAKIDGLGPLSTYMRIMIIETMPAFIAQFIFGFVGSYNNYMGPLLYLDPNDYGGYTLQYVLGFMKSSFGEPGQQCALALLSMIPLIILYLIFQRFFIEGIAVGGGKE